MHLRDYFVHVIVFQKSPSESLAVFCDRATYANKFVSPEYPWRNILTLYLFYFFMTIVVKYFYGKYVVFERRPASVCSLLLMRRKQVIRGSPSPPLHHFAPRDAQGDWVLELSLSSAIQTNKNCHAPEIREWSWSCLGFAHIWCFWHCIFPFWVSTYLDGMTLARSEREWAILVNEVSSFHYKSADLCSWILRHKNRAKNCLGKLLLFIYRFSDLNFKPSAFKLSK